MRKAYTIIELLVAVALLAAVMAVSGIVFREAVRAHRISAATTEISRKLRAITEQLDQDFGGLRKDGLIFIAHRAVPVYDQSGSIIDRNGDGVADEYDRNDTVMFFADGNFQSYNQWITSTPPVEEYLVGNLARICYGLAVDDSFVIKNYGERSKRVLARNQHIYHPQIIWDRLTPPANEILYPDFAAIPSSITEAENATLTISNSLYEHDSANLDDWLIIDDFSVYEMITAITGVIINVDLDGDMVPDTNAKKGGIIIEDDDPSTYHNLFAEGIGSFSVQIWYDRENRWVPQIDPDGDFDLTDDSDFFVDGATGELRGNSLPGVFYVPEPLAAVSPFPKAFYGSNSSINLVFLDVPGDALKFTFTLFDSRGVFEQGKTFTHIVYLD